MHQQGLGNTAIVVGALRSGDIDLYAEYTGTIAKEILKLDAVPPLAELNARLAPMNLGVAVPLGFNNTYALAVRGDDARAKGLARLSDLKAHPELRLGLSQEFIGRADGWEGLKRAYDLPFATPRGLDHGLAYEAIAQRQVDVIDIYSTDAKIDKYGLVVLQDDRQYFPRYDAVLLYRAELPQRLPRTWSSLRELEGRIDDATMRRMNAEAELQGRSFTDIAAEFLAHAPAASAASGATTGTATTGTAPAGTASVGTASTGTASTGTASPGAASTVPPATPAPSTGSADFWRKLAAPDFGRLTLQHLTLVLLSLAASIVVGIPLGILAAKQRGAEGVVLGAVGIVQTIPALALLAALIPITGHIGVVPALIALSLYALLPIVRNTHAGLVQVPNAMREAARSLGLEARTILHVIELPLAARTIVAGIKTSAVISVGAATIAAFIGAGGYGERIVTGLALNDHAMLLAGAIPAAALAMLIEGAFRLGERWAVPAGLRA